MYILEAKSLYQWGVLKRINLVFVPLSCSFFLHFQVSFKQVSQRVTNCTLKSLMTFSVTVLKLGLKNTQSY